MSHRYPVIPTVAAALLIAGLFAAPARSQTLDVMGLGLVSGGHAKVRLTVTAGPSGAPNGFEVCYMPQALFTSTYGGVWPAPWGQGEGWVDYTGTGTLHTWGTAAVDFKLGPNQSLDVEIGDTYDETGVSGTWTSQLVDGTAYVFCAYAIPDAGGTASALSVTLSQATTSEGDHCVWTQGYWKNHPGAWPVSSLVLGGVSYTQAQLLSILGTPTGGNGLISLAHQLIATELNVAAGADPTPVASTISAADALIASVLPALIPPIGAGYLAPSATSAYTQTLDDFNNDVDGSDHCKHTTPAHGSTWGKVKSTYR